MITRREALKVMAMGGGALLLSGMEFRMEGESQVESIRNSLEGKAFVANNSLVEVIRMEYYNGQWRETTNVYPDQYDWLYGPELAVVNNVAFNAVKVGASLVPASQTGGADYYSFSGYMSDMTGDKSRWKVELGRYFPGNNGWQWLVTPRGDGFNAYGGLEESYGAWARRSFYPNKIYNLLRGLMDFRYAAINGFGPGEECSYLKTINLAGHMNDPNYYLWGWDSYDRRTYGGGLCASVDAMANATHRAERKGWARVVFHKEHGNNREYYVNQEDRDVIDATAGISDDGVWVDLITQNTSDRRLFYYPTAELLLPSLPEGYRLPNSMKMPDQSDKEEYLVSSALVFSMTLTDRQPSLADSQSVENSFWRMVEHQARFGTGKRGGFNEYPYE